MMNEEQTRLRLQAVRGRTKPTAFERDLIEEAMWTEYGRSLTIGPVGLVEVVSAAPVLQASSNTRQRGVLIAAVAAGLLLLGGMIGFNQSRVVDQAELEVVTTVTNDPLPPELSSTVARRWGPVDVTFPLPAGRVKERSSENSILLGSRLRAPSGSMQGRILVGLVKDFQIAPGLVRQARESGSVRSFTVAVDQPTAFGTVDGTDLVFEANSANEVDVYPLSGTDDVVIVWTPDDSGAERFVPILPELEIVQR